MRDASDNQSRTGSEPGESVAVSELIEDGCRRVGALRKLHILAPAYREMQR